MIELWKNIIYESLLVKKIIEYYEDIKNKKMKEEIEKEENKK